MDAHILLLFHLNSLDACIVECRDIGKVLVYNGHRICIVFMYEIIIFHLILLTPSLFSIQFY